MLVRVRCDDAVSMPGWERSRRMGEMAANPYTLSDRARAELNQLADLEAPDRMERLLLVDRQDEGISALKCW